MRQYFEAKRQHRDAIVFFRMGDFYEMFYEDALTAARALELTLTSRSKDSTGGAIPMCGVPFHAADGYIARLVKKGFRVAVCEQMEDPKKAKGHRAARSGPGRVARHAHRCRLSRCAGAGVPHGTRSVVGRAGYGVALIDLSTGEFSAAESLGTDARQALADELAVLRPREIVASPDWTDLPALVEGASNRSADHPRRRLDVRVRSGAPVAPRSTQNPEPARLWSRRPPPPFAPPVRSCSTCARPRRPTWRTCARSRSAPAPTV